MAFRIASPNPMYLSMLGSELAPVSNGTLTFYQSGTTTLADTFSDAACTIPNANPVVLDAFGQTGTDIFGNIAYSVALADSSGVVLWVKDNVQPDSDIPSQAGNDGKFLSTKGSALLWNSVVQVPDTTGVPDGYVVTCQTAAPVWAKNTASVDGTTVSNIVLKQDREAAQDVTAAGTTTLDYALGGVVNLAQAVDITTLAFAHLPVAGETAIFTIKRKKDNSGTSRAITWPASFKWPGGVPPTLTQTANAVDIISIMTDDGGTTWFGSYVVAMA